MLRNYLIIAFRNLIRQKFFSLINILGLAIGLACTLLILLWVQDELSFDRFHENAARLYQVEEDQHYSGEIYHVTVTPYPSGPVWKTEIPEIEDACRYQWPDGMLFRRGDKSFYERGTVAVDPSFFTMFSFQLLKGDPDNLLQEPYTAVLTDETANKYFGNEDPVGLSLTVNNKYEFTVSGIIKKPPRNSTLDFDILIPFEYLRETGQYSDNWGTNSIRTYVSLHEKANIDSVNAKMTRIQRANVPESLTDFIVFPFTRVHLHQYFGYGHPPTAVIFVYIFSIIALLVLIIACINFMNLSTAKSAVRAKEIGIRKVAGSSRKNLILQFYGESFLLTLISMLCALIIVSLVLSVFNNIASKELLFSDLWNIKFILGLIIVLFFTSFVSGIYPAVFLSSFKIVNVMKGEPVSGIHSGLFRKILVVFQFTLSVMLIIGTVVIYMQLIYMKNIDLGYDKEHVLYTWIRGEMRDKYYTLKEELLKNPDVKGVTASWHSPTHIGSNSSGADWEGKDPDMKVLIGLSGVDFDFIETMGINITKGRSFSKDYPSDLASDDDTTGAFLINEELARIMGMEDPVGQRFDFIGIKGIIVGVMKDFHFQPAREKIEPLAILCSGSRYFSTIIIKLGPGDLTGSMKEVEKIWNEILPLYPFEYQFLDEDFDRTYRAEARMSKIVQYFTILTIIIACMGLFGLSSFTAERRTHEIGIRKVVGAKVSNIAGLLSWEFTVLVIISCIIAIPVAYFVLNRFLQEFAYHVNLSWWIFALAAFAALLIANLTVSYQAIKAAFTNPADALRYE